MQFGFGSGSLWGIDSGVNPTPGRFGILQEASVDFAYSSKELYGTYQFPVTIARGTAKITAKAKFAQLLGRVMNSLFFNNTKAAGQLSVAQDETLTIAAGAATAANGANYVDDLGLRYSVTGLSLVRVAAAPAAGQYTVNTATGVYAFNVSENGTVLKADYSFNVAATGEKISITNPLLGQAPTFKAVFTQLYNGLRQTLTLNANISQKLSIGSKLEDFVMPEWDMAAFSDAALNIGTWSLGEAS